jgi:antitoxin VapB
MRREMTATAKIIMDEGDSQTVLLPEEFHFEGTEVRISKVGDKVILEPVARTEAEIAAGQPKTPCA